MISGVPTARPVNQQGCLQLWAGTVVGRDGGVDGWVMVGREAAEGSLEAKHGSLKDLVLGSGQACECVAGGVRVKEYCG